MILPNGHDDLVHRTDRPLLPYTLTKGVTATRDGLVFRDEGLFSFIAEIGSEEELFQAETVYDGMFDDPIMQWPDAAERLRYREGEPWCTETLAGSIICPKRRADTDTERGLHSLAAILCDGAEAFRVLHWCVTEFGQRIKEVKDDLTPF